MPRAGDSELRGHLPGGMQVWPGPKGLGDEQVVGPECPPTGPGVCWAPSGHLPRLE